jgi:hypothetical protein
MASFDGFYATNPGPYCHPDAIKREGIRFQPGVFHGLDASNQPVLDKAIHSTRFLRGQELTNVKIRNLATKPNGITLCIKACYWLDT